MAEDLEIKVTSIDGFKHRKKTFRFDGTLTQVRQFFLDYPARRNKYHNETKTKYKGTVECLDGKKVTAIFAFVEGAWQLYAKTPKELQKVYEKYQVLFTGLKP